MAAWDKMIDLGNYGQSNRNWGGMHINPAGLVGGCCGGAIGWAVANADAARSLAKAATIFD